MYQPDIFDLNDWVLTLHPEVYEATKYLHAPIQYKAWLEIWEQAGRPDISEEQYAIRTIQ